MPGLIDPTAPMAIPPGFCQLSADYTYDSARTPSRGAARYSALTLLSGACGRGHNTYTGTGLNTYNVYVAPTGSGKDCIPNSASAHFNSIPMVEGAKGFLGPAQIVSAPGALQRLQKNPALICNIGEFGKRLQEWSNPRNPVGAGIQIILREAYTRSGKGKSLGSSAYKDEAKNIDIINSPALTIAAEGVPSEFFGTLDESIISGGTLSRFSVFIDDEPRSYSNLDSGNVSFPNELSNLFGNIVAKNLSLAHRGTPHVVLPCSDARSMLDAFDDECTDIINDSASDEVLRQLWNRAYLKALKWASLSAISWDYIDPTICVEDAIFGIALVRRQTEQIISKFQRGEVGAVEGDEGKQTTEVLRIMRHYASSKWEQVQSYHGTETMHKDGVITKAHITQRLQNTAAFKNDREKPTAAIKRVLVQLLSNDEIRQIPQSQMVAKYGSHPEAYVVSDFTRLLKL
jgi:hypothetical protein